MSVACPSRSRRGIATLFAVLMLTLVGLSLAGLSAALASELRRTHAYEHEAQLRQLMLAGEAWTTAQMDAGHAIAARQPVPLPPTPMLANAQVTVEPMPGGQPDWLTIRAVLGDRVATGNIRVIQSPESRLHTITARSLGRLR